MPADPILRSCASRTSSCLAGPIYAPARAGTGGMASVNFARETASRIEAGYISQQVTRMEGAVDTQPGLAIGTAKEFAERI